MLKRILLGTVLVVGIAVSAAAQLWPNIPIIGGAAYCSSTTNTTCVNTVPAGPAISGSETVPLDTNFPSGRGPQVAKVAVATLGLGGLQNIVPTTNQFFVVGQGVGRVFLNPAGTIAALSLMLQPAANLVDGQVLFIGTSQTVTTLTLTAGSGTTLSSASTTVTAAAPLMYIYSAAGTTWYKIK